jgi:hypothetical protein
VKFGPRKISLKTNFRSREENVIDMNRPLRTTFLLISERFDHSLGFLLLEESALVTLVKIHSQTKQKHRELKKKPGVPESDP